MKLVDCINCGKKVALTDIKCDICGAEQPEATTVQATKGCLSTIVIIIIVLSVIALLN